VGYPIERFAIRVSAFAIYQSLASGVATGCIYALLATSLVVIYKSTEVVNFAGGEVLMTGAYLAMLALVYFEFPYIAAFGFAAIGLFVIAGGFEVTILRTIAKRDRHGPVLLVSLVVATIGLAYILRGTIRLFNYTEEPRRLALPFPGPPLQIGPVFLQRQDMIIIAVSIIVMAALFAFFRFTLAGKALQATSQNPSAAALIGIPVRKLRTYVWGGACALSALAGVLVGAKFLVTPDFGGQVILLAFAAAIIGGFNSLPGCIIGGIVLGVIQNLVGLLVSSSAISVAPFLVIMIVLAVRPQGLLGGRSVLRKV
jgi:branched-chain amino acid transport system permease protein